MWETRAIADSYRGEATEDRWAILERGANSLLLVVADGVGGRPFGGATADRSVALVRERHHTVKSGDTDGWASLLTHIDSDLSACDGTGETTLCLVEVTAQGIFGASAGDSEAWRIPASPTLPPVILTSSQRTKPFVGSGMARAVTFRGKALAPDETLLVATDGLFKYADTEHILNAARLPSISSAADALVQAAHGSTSGRLYDDLAILVCRCTAESPPRQEGEAGSRRRILSHLADLILPARRKHP